MKNLALLGLLLLLISCGKDSESTHLVQDCSEKAKKLLDISITEGVESYTEMLKETRTFDIIFGVPLAGGRETYEYTTIYACQPQSCISGYKKINLTDYSSKEIVKFICVKEENCVNKSLKSSYTIPEILKNLLISDLIDSTNSVSDECVTSPPLDILGCMDSRASNYNSQATQSDMSCECSNEAVYSEEFGCAL